MSLEKYKVKLSKNKERNGEYTPQYSLQYKVVDNPKHSSYRILSAIIGERDVIIELNTELFEEILKKSRNTVPDFLNHIQSFHLKYRNETVTSTHQLRILGIPMDNKTKKEARVILAYVPNLIWKSEMFKDALPSCGARYYITKKPLDAEPIMEALLTMAEEKKEETFQYIVFNLAHYGQMGIASQEDDSIVTCFKS